MRRFSFREKDSIKRKIKFEMIDDSGDPLEGGSLTISISKAGQTSYSAISGSYFEVSNGTYEMTLSESDLDTIGPAMIMVAAEGVSVLQKLPIEIYDSSILNQILVPHLREFHRYGLNKF